MKSLAHYLLILPVAAVVAALTGPLISELLMLSSQSEMLTVSMVTFVLTAAILRLGMRFLGR